MAYVAPNFSKIIKRKSNCFHSISFHLKLLTSIFLDVDLVLIILCLVWKLLD